MAKLSIHQSIYVLTLTYCHRLPFQYFPIHLTSAPTCQRAIPTSLPDSPHLNSQLQFICCQTVYRLIWLTHSLFFAFMTEFPVFFLGQISRLQFCFVMTSSPCLCPGKDLCLLFLTTSFICVLPDSWLPVSTSAELQESLAITSVGFISPKTFSITPSPGSHPPWPPGLLQSFCLLYWISC